MAHTLQQTRAGRPKGVLGPSPTPKLWEKEVNPLWLPHWPLSQAHPPCSFLFGARCHSGSQILAVVSEGHPRLWTNGTDISIFLTPLWWGALWAVGAVLGS